jgi:hypothetical protein
VEWFSVEVAVQLEMGDEIPTGGKNKTIPVANGDSGKTPATRVPPMSQAA